MDANWNSSKLLDIDGSLDRCCLTDERSDQILCRPEGCTGLELHYLEFCTESS
jgi:hypothetical protein